MARRIKSRKRKHYGNRTFGGGNTKNRRGKGNKGGKGHAGYHKHKWLHTIKFEGTKSKKIGFRNPTSKVIIVTSLKELNNEIAKGKWAKDASGVFQINLGHSKVLGNGSIDFKANVSAGAFSKNAKEKIEKAGGSAAVLQ